MAYELKTTPNEASVKAFLDQVEDEKRRTDSYAVLELMREVTGLEPKMWGQNIVGFGEQHYRYETGNEGDWFYVGFSPRKANLTFYLTNGFEEHQDLMEKLGKHKTGKSCLYVKRLEDVDLEVLSALVRRALETQPGANSAP